MATYAQVKRAVTKRGMDFVDGAYRTLSYIARQVSRLADDDEGRRRRFELDNNARHVIANASLNAAGIRGRKANLVSDYLDAHYDNRVRIERRNHA